MLSAKRVMKFWYFPIAKSANQNRFVVYFIQKARNQISVLPYFPQLRVYGFVKLSISLPFYFGDYVTIHDRAYMIKKK